MSWRRRKSGGGSAPAASDADDNSSSRDAPLLRFDLAADGHRQAKVYEFKDMVLVDIREFYRKFDGTVAPAAKGISLKADEFRALVAHKDQVLAVLADAESRHTHKKQKTGGADSAGSSSSSSVPSSSQQSPGSARPEDAGEQAGEAEGVVASVQVKQEGAGTNGDIGTSNAT